VFDAPAAHAAAPHAPQAGASVSITDSGFNPSTLNVTPGTTVTWTNNSSEERRIDELSNHIFRSDDLAPGDTFSYTFSTPDTFYYEEDRDDFQGTIVVSGPTPTPSGGLGSVTQVYMVSGDNFSPSTVYISTGTTVRWTNNDHEQHSTSSTNAPVNDTWQSPDLDPGKSYEKTFLNPGTFSYLCTFHEDEMFGTVVVSGPAISPTPGPATSTPASGTSNVNIQGNQYQPKDHVVALGSTVHWTNLDSINHSVTSNTPGAFDSGGLGQNGTFNKTFTTAGRYDYHCQYHPGMAGSIVVLTGDGSVPTAGPSNTPTMTNTPQPTNTPGGGPVSDASIIDYDYSPTTINIQPGTTVRWTNNGQAPHTVTSDGAGQFNSGQIASNTWWQFTFNTPGTYNFHCDFHPTMKGTVNVLAPGSTPIPQPSNTPAPTNTPQATNTPGGGPMTNALVVDYNYNPTTINVQPGTTVRWTNSGQAPHTVTSDVAGQFNSGQMASGSWWQFTFNTPGTYNFHCDFHSNMQGTINVLAPGSTPIPQPSNTPRPTSTPMSQPLPGTVRVAIEHYAYAPMTTTVNLGDKVVWTNLDNDRHSVTSNGDHAGLFDSGVFALNGTYERVFDTPGTYKYYCTVHGNFMTGYVVVQNSGGVFSDVALSNTFYPYIVCLSDRSVLGGYSDGTFRPGNQVTRGQLAKIIANSAGFNETPTGQTFADVAPGSTFYDYVERIASRGIIGGYPCGGPGEPCQAGSKPYFRPGDNASRGQIAKIVAGAANLTSTPTGQTFADVPTNHTFYTFVEQLSANGAMGGYACGSPGEACDGQNRPYFRPNVKTTRGQIAKIVSMSFFPECAN
jgi:plastocyanin